MSVILSLSQKKQKKKQGQGDRIQRAGEEAEKQVLDSGIGEERGQAERRAVSVVEEELRVGDLGSNGEKQRGRLERQKEKAVLIFADSQRFLNILLLPAV